MGYIVRIKDLAVYAYNGVNPEEQALGQIFLISAALHTNLDDVVTDDDALLRTTLEVDIFHRQRVEPHTSRLRRSPH